MKMIISIFYDNLLEDKEKRKEFCELIEGKRIKKVKVFESLEGPDIKIILDDGTKIIASGYEYDLWVETQDEEEY